MKLPSFLKRAVGLIGVGTPQDPVLARWWGAYTPTHSGIQISEETALNYSAVFRAVALISGHVSRLPLNVYQKESNVSRKLLEQHPLIKLLNRRCNPYMPSRSLRETMTSHVLLWGNAYAEIERDQGMRPLALHLIKPSRVTPELDTSGNVRYKIAMPGTEPRYIAQGNMLHLAGLGFDGLVGYSVVRYARESIGLGVAAETYGATFYGNGSKPGGIIKIPDRLDEIGLRRLRAEWERIHSGPENGNRVAILEQGADWQPTSIPPNDAQFLETREFQIVEICRWFGIPPHKLFDLSRATFSNIEMQSLEFLQDCLANWLRVWEEACMFALLMENEQDLYIEHATASLLKTDIKSRYESYNQARLGGWKSANDILAMENDNPIGPQGDIYLSPGNYHNAEDVADGTILAMAQQPAASPTDSGGSSPDANKNQKRDILPKFVGSILSTTVRRSLADVVEDAIGRTVRKESARVRHLAKSPEDFSDKVAIFYADLSADVPDVWAPACRMYRNLTTAELQIRNFSSVRDSILAAGPHGAEAIVTSWDISAIARQLAPMAYEN